jgi:hypothetical protein
MHDVCPGRSVFKGYHHRDRLSKTAKAGLDSINLGSDMVNEVEGRFFENRTEVNLLRPGGKNDQGCQG